MDVAEITALAFATDTKLADLFEQRFMISQRHQHVLDALHQLAGDTETDRYHLLSRKTSWQMPIVDVLERLADPSHKIHPKYTGWDVDNYIDQHHEMSCQLNQINIDIVQLEEIYRQHRWSRFFLVQNTNGHIHSSRECHTCFDDTRFGWCPQLSGKTEADAVAELGAILCTVCFPSAPVEWTSGEAKATLEAKAARAAAKAERDAKKLAKALLPDGSDLVVQIEGRSERIKTLAAGKSWLTNAFSWNASYPKVGYDGVLQTCHPSYPPEAIEQVTEAVAAKTGETVDQIQAAAQKRAEKRK